MHSVVLQLSTEQLDCMRNSLMFHDRDDTVTLNVRVGDVDYDLRDVLKEKFGSDFDLIAVNTTILEERKRARQLNGRSGQDAVPSQL